MIRWSLTLGIKNKNKNKKIPLVGGVYVIPFQNMTVVFLVENHNFGKKIISRLVQSGNKSKYKSYKLKNLKLL